MDLQGQKEGTWPSRDADISEVNPQKEEEGQA